LRGFSPLSTVTSGYMGNFIRLCKKLHSSEKSYEWSKGLSALNNINNKTKIVAFLIVFSALYAALRPVPLGPMIGLSQTFSVSDFLAPLYGIILGPYIGGLSIIIGTFLGMTVKAPVFFGLDFLTAFANCIAIGFLMKKKWALVVVLNIFLLLAFILNPLTTLFFGPVPFFWLHIVALVVLISPLGRKAGQWVETLKPKFLTAGIAVLAFIGTMMQHLTGNILTEVMLGQIVGSISPETFSTFIWPGAFLVYPVERTVLVILSVVIGVPLVRTIKKSLLPFQEQQSKE
jgi:hypothetical protein